MYNYNQFIANVHPSSLSTSWGDALLWGIFTTLSVLSCATVNNSGCRRCWQKTGMTDSTCHQHLEQHLSAFSHPPARILLHLQGTQQ